MAHALSLRRKVSTIARHPCACTQGVLDATSIELSARLLEPLVATLNELLAEMVAAAPQRQPALWSVPLLRALTEIYRGATSSGAALSRGLLLLLLPLLEAGSSHWVQQSR